MFTPGPWHVSTSGNYVRADLPGAPTVAAVSPLGSIETPANARLIAAAPDLLAALRDLLDAPKTRPDDSGGELEAHYLQRQHDARVAARAALRKAEGQE